MPDRYAYESPFARGGDPWFRVGSVDVTTTTAVVGLAVFGILLRVVEGTSGAISRLLLLSSEALTGGQLWRFFTWTIPPDSQFMWALLGIFFFFMIGSQFESMLGRRPFAVLVGSLILIPGVLGVLTAVLFSETIPAFGLSLLFLGVAAGFAASMPQARTFFNIPFWALLAFFFFVQFLTLLTVRSVSGLVMLSATALIGLVVTKSFGFAESVEWIPTVPIPGSAAATTSRPVRPPRQRRSRSSSSHLRAVPPVASDAEIDALLDQVSEQGIDSLTKQQKKTLEQHSKEMKRRRDET